MPKNLKKIIGTGILLLALGGNMNKNLNPIQTGVAQKRYIKQPNNVEKAIYMGAFVGTSLLATLGIHKLLTKYRTNENA